MKERTELLESNAGEISTLIDQRRSKEQHNRKAREDKVEEVSFSHIRVRNGNRR